jgi:regulator of protease activity HflC (stomatin/prohibitin superfamily)/membrane protein implicated in regulation of membrane protease activity
MGAIMSVEWAWWIVAAVLVGAELLTGTFYLLAIGMAVAFGGVAAFAGASLPMQFAVAGVLGVVLTGGCASAAPVASDTAAAAFARHRANGARGYLERRWDGARQLSRDDLGCRAGHARGAAGRDDVHHRHPRIAADPFRPPSAGLTRAAAGTHPETRSNAGGIAMWLGSSLFTIALFVVAIIVISRAIRVVPQQHALVIERLGRFYAVLQPGLNFVIPFVDRVAYKHDLREIPFDVPSQVCITKDNTQLQVDGILYFQVTDPRLASYGSSNFQVAITQLAQTTLRSVIGRMELDRTFEERDHINGIVVTALDQAAANWGVKVLRYEIKDLTPPKEILHAMQAQITAEREKRAVIATSEGKQQEQINLATGARAAAIAKVRGREAGRDQPGAGSRLSTPRRSRRPTRRRSGR